MKKLISYVIVFVIGFVACAYTIKNFGFTLAGTGKQNLLQNLSSTTPVSMAKKGESPIADAAAEVGPSVVSIYTAIERTVEGPYGGMFPQRQQGSGAGSGVIISSDGYILTNNHVVEDARKIKVRLKDGRNFDARLIGKDAVTEVAVIKVNATGLPAATFGNSDSLRIGDWAIAVGNPLGILENTVTVGVISAAGRNEAVREGTVLRGLIQTDAAINPGNSGGALANIKGEVIGINTMIFSPGPGAVKGNIGIGFAIPINSARKVAKELIENGRVSHPYLGIVIHPLSGDYLQYYHQRGFKGDKGALVWQISPNSPAASAGLMQGDIMTEVEGETINTHEDVVKSIQKLKVGQLIKLTIWREGKITSIVAKLTEMPQNMQ